jgi:hypothetical protein
MRKWLEVLAVAAFVLIALCGRPAGAQDIVSAQTVSACGTPNNTPVVKQSYPITQDTTGKLCTSGSGGGGGSVTITSPIGPGADSTGVTVTLATSAITALNNINTNVQAPIPAGSNIIGKVDIDQTTPGTTNGVQDAATGATGSTAPTKAIYAGGISSGNLTGIIQGDTTNAIAISTGTTTQVIALAASKKTYITSLSILPVSAAVNITIEYGTGTNCATVVGYLAGSASIPAATLTTGEGWTESAGLGPEYVVPSGDEICIVTSGSSNVGGHVTFTQF